MEYFSRLEKMAIVRYIGIEGIEESAAYECARILDGGGVVIYPTETIYGIGADCENEDAIRRVNIIKGREEDAPQIVLIALEWIDRYVENAKVLEPLIDAFLPGPLTMISRVKKKSVPKILAPDGKIAVRVSPAWFVQSVLKNLGRGITSTSANFSAEKPLVKAKEIIPAFWDDVDAMFLYKDEVLSSAPSTIIDVSRFPEKYEIIREGAISGEAIENALKL